MHDQHANPKTDIQIAQEATIRPILDIARTRLGIDPKDLLLYGHYKAKISLDYLRTLESRPNAKLILVTAITPTPAGEGKTTTTVGLGDALNKLGRKAIICLREPSLGPCFGVKGGAAGGGYAQVVPMEDINLHFTGDFHAIGVANNLLAAMVDNHIYSGNSLGLDVRRILWRRSMDMNDRALREMVVALGEVGNGFPRQDGFDITAASEVMAVFCLASDLADLKRRLGNMVVGQTREKKYVRAEELHAAGAMSALLKDAFAPNLVQTIEGGARGSSAVAVARVAGRAMGSVADGRTTAAIAGRAAVPEGAAARDTTWQSAHSSGWTRWHALVEPDSTCAPEACWSSRSRRTSASSAAEGSANCSTAQSSANDRHVTLRRIVGT